jgi:hypothetical protein
MNKYERKTRAKTVLIMSSVSITSFVCPCDKVLMQLIFSLCCGTKVVSDLGVMFIVSRIFFPGGVSLNYIF